VLLDFDVNHVRMTANGAVLYIFLYGAGGKIDRDHDLLAAGIAEITGLFRGHVDFR
jgi:hypothetical protein